MYQRLLKPSANNSFLLFGARGTGKTTFVHSQFFSATSPSLSINLLQPNEYDRYIRNPGELSAALDALRPKKRGRQWVMIDEIQRVPELLNVVHEKIETGKWLFALTGSSARKLKRGAANLLAGRAFVYHLFPLTDAELGPDFNLQKSLEWGTLPKVYTLKNTADRMEFLNSYTQTYLKEEIQEEQLVRKMRPFRNFMDVAAQCSGTIINYSNIARDCGTDPVSIQSYFEILADTMLGFELPPFHQSIRKRQRKNPKFYLFDLGVKRALDGSLGTPLRPATSAFGMHFEHWVIQEAVRMSSYSRKNYRFSYLRTRDDVEIDLIVERPGQPLTLIEIKSTTSVRENDLASFSRIAAEFPGAKKFCLSRDPLRKHIGEVECLPFTNLAEALGLS